MTDAGTLRRNSADGPDASGGKAQLVTPDAFMIRFGQTVRLHARREKLTIVQLAADAGISHKRLCKLIDNDPLERRQATASELLSIWGVLRDKAASRDLALIGMAAEDAEEEEPGKLGHLVAEMFAAGSQLAQIGADGVIDASEADQAEAAADVVEAKAEQLRKMARRARHRR